jgi:uncharacterized protein YigE (DUF2233 family)
MWRNKMWQLTQRLQVRRALSMALLAVLIAGCGTIDPNATPAVLYPTRVPFGQLPTFFAGSPQPGVTQFPLPATPTVPPINATPPTLVFPTALPFTRIVPTPVPATVIPTIDANWNQIAAGVVWRTITFRVPSTQQTASILVVRMDPRLVQFRVHYQPNVMRDITQWQLALPGAVAIINANFYDKNNRPLGLVASDGVLTGASIPRNDVGVLQVTNVSGSLSVKVRSFFLEPYRNTEIFQQVVQGLPMLMVAGQVAPAFNPDLSTAPDFRSIIAQDKSGRILFIVTQYVKVTLTDMARLLGVSGLEINTAVNMDGGSSTQFFMASGGANQITRGLKTVPVVVAAYRR